MRGVLDTSVVIGRQLRGLEGELAVSSVTWAELHFGVLVARDDGVRAERLRRLSVLQARFEALPVDDAVARSYGTLAAAVARAGRSPRPRALDLLIAATAHAHAARLYTVNPLDLQGLEGELEVVGITG